MANTNIIKNGNKAKFDNLPNGKAIEVLATVAQWALGEISKLLFIANEAEKIVLEELKMELEGLGEKSFRAKQLYEWLHVKLVDSFDEMTNISKALREKLEQQYQIPAVRMLERQESMLDGTNKF